MEFTVIGHDLDPKGYKLKSLSLKNYERVRDIRPPNILYLFYFLYGPSRFTHRLEQSSFAYLFNTPVKDVFGAMYDYKGRISCGMYYPAALDSNGEEYSDAVDKTARVLTDLIDRVVIKPIKVGDSKFFAKSGRFEYSGKDFFEEFDLDKL